MAKKIYVGRAAGHMVSYLDNSTTETLVNTGIKYGPGIGFELDFTYSNSLTTSGYKHILNAGGTGNSTSLCLSVYNGKLSLEACKSSSGKSNILQNVTITQGTRYVVSWTIDTTQNKAFYTVKNHATGDVVGSTSVTISDLDYLFDAYICIYNQEKWGKTSSTTRAAFIKFYSMKIYDNGTLVANLVPDPNGVVGEEAQIYDTESGNLLAYKYSGTSAIYNEESEGSLPAVEAKKIYVGVNGETKLVKKIYVGVNGTPKLAYDTTT